MKLELDHVFVFVEPGGVESTQRLVDLGLVPSFQRTHDGQGTANVCFAFDNAYLELLWVEDAAHLAEATFARTGLYERSQWRTLGTSPFGVCVRAPRPLPFDCWLWRPPYLPPSFFLEVSVTSTDPNVPFLFDFPGAEPPTAWPPARAAGRQRDAGFTRIEGLQLAALPGAEELAELRLAPELTRQQAVLSLSRADGGPARDLLLPACRWRA